LFWHRIWKENGAPREGHIADIRNRTRAKYHYAIRHIHKHNEQILSNKLSTSLLSKNPKDFWKKVRNIKKDSKKRLPSMFSG
jgi:hypothetical protein